MPSLIRSNTHFMPSNIRKHRLLIVDGDLNLSELEHLLARQGVFEKIEHCNPESEIIANYLPLYDFVLMQDPELEFMFLNWSGNFPSFLFTFSQRGYRLIPDDRVFFLNTSQGVNLNKVAKHIGKLVLQSNCA